MVPGTSSARGRRRLARSCGRGRESPQQCCQPFLPRVLFTPWGNCRQNPAAQFRVGKALEHGDQLEGRLLHRFVTQEPGVLYAPDPFLELGEGSLPYGDQLSLGL